MRLLFVKDELAWPRKSGHDVHAYYMMRSLQALGHELGLVTRHRCDPGALDGLPLAHYSTLSEGTPAAGSVRLGRLQERFRSYWGVQMADLEKVAAIASVFRPDVLVAVGLDGLPYVAAAGGARTVWYAADEWFLHHLSLMSPGVPASWRELKPATIKLLYERAYARRVDRTWVVSGPDRRAMRWLAGMRGVDVLPNGVDASYFSPAGGPTIDESCAFWGRLDFEPNTDALQWFCTQVWPLVLREHPAAKLRIIGANPGPAVRAYGDLPGVSIHADVPDLRPLLHDIQVAVMPFVGGAGIKNKILEAAALAKPVICTPRARGGLRGEPPFAVARGAADWARELSDLWRNATRRASLGAAARDWVASNHSWDTTARAAVEALGR